MGSQRMRVRIDADKEKDAVPARREHEAAPARVRRLQRPMRPVRREAETGGAIASLNPAALLRSDAKGARHAQGIAVLQQYRGNARVQTMLEAQRAEADDGEGNGLVDRTVQTLCQEKGPGRPLDESTRVEMEQVLKHDLGAVRVHTDEAATRASAALRANAFTMGTEIYFAEGRGRDFSSSAEKRLLAHELAHVVQQSEGSLSLTGGRVKMGRVGDRYEREADAVADKALGGARDVQRQAEEEEEEEEQAQKSAASLQRQAEEEEEAQECAQSLQRETAPEQSDEETGDAQTSLFEDEMARPEDAEDVMGLTAPTAGTHDDVVALMTGSGMAAPQRTLAYGFTAWSPRTAATFPNVKIRWTPSGRRWTAVVERTTARMGTVVARYIKPGTYQIPGGPVTARYPQCGPGGKQVPAFSKVSQEMSGLAKMAEQEHCNDYQQAYDLSLKKCADSVNAMAGRRLGPDTQAAIEQQVLRQIGGKTPRQWVQELNRLTRLSLTRDQGDHRLKADGEPKSCPADCSKVVLTTVKSPTTKIPGPSSKDLIK